MYNTPPFFILANPRSGSSLLRIICESHTQISVPPESGFMEWWYDKYKDWNISDSFNISKVKMFVRDIMSSKKIETWYLNSDVLIKDIQKKKPKDYASLIALIYILFASNRNKNLKVWGDKNNYYIHKTKLLNHLYPNAKYIHLIRDGRDVATSYMALRNLESKSSYLPKLTYDIGKIAKEWNKNNLNLLSFFESIDKSRVHLVKFEEIITNLHKVCMEITDFLEVPFEQSMLQYYILNRNQQIEPAETLDWKRKTLEEPDKEAVNKYKKLLTSEEISIFNQIAGESLLIFGYE